MSEGKQTVYEYFDKQTVKERRAMSSYLIENGASKQRVYQWTARRANIPVKYQELIKQHSGLELSFPRLASTLVLKEA